MYMPPITERNRSIDILRNIAITLVVLGHMFPIPGIMWLQHYFPIYSYHMALFLFVSGYLFKDMEWQDYGAFVWRKTYTLAIPLIAWNVVYAGIVSLINLRHPTNYFPTTESIWNIHNLFVEPFIGGHQYILNLSTWFVGMLYLALLIYGLFHLISKKIPEWLLLLIFAIMAFTAIYSATLPTNIRILLVPQRIAYALFFIQFGRCFRIYIEHMITAKNIGWILLIILIARFGIMIGGDHAYVLVWMRFDGDMLRPLLLGMLGCLFWMLLSIQIAHLIKPNKLEILIGTSTWSIMTHHLLVRFMICWIVVHFSNDLSLREKFVTDLWFFPPGVSIYIMAIVLEIGLPILWQFIFDKFKKRIQPTYICNKL